MRTFHIGKRSFEIREYRNLGRHEGGFILDPYVVDEDFNESVGDVESTGHYGLVHGPLQLGAIKEKEEDFQEELTRDERDYLMLMAGAIVETNHQGFITVDYFSDKTALQYCWEILSEQVAVGAEHA
jgi:hypothetical protein